MFFIYVLGKIDFPQHIYKKQPDRSGNLRYFCPLLSNESIHHFSKNITHMILENYETDRLRFRSLTLTDREPLLAFFNDPKATKYLSIQTDTDDFTDTWLNRQIKRYANIDVGLCAVELRATNELVGQCGLVRQFVDGIPKWEVGYHLLPQFWGNGYATEAAIACCNVCFKNEMAETVISLIHPDNEKSKAVALRNNMTFWKKTIFKGQDCNVYRIRREDWEKLGRVKDVATSVCD